MNMVDTSAIAIVGIGCRFPGEINNPQELWQFLVAGCQSITTVPASRFELTTPKGSENFNGLKGGFINDIDLFDPEFFAISPATANHLDPQQRLLLECSFEALEDAGILTESIAATNASVFVGSSNSEYQMLMYQSSSKLDLTHINGSSRASMANRISNFYDLHGQSIQIDTGCSSTLVALHHACKNLANSESELALVGGCDLILSPCTSMALAASGLLSDAGVCRFGSQQRDGYVPSEAVAVIALKPLILAKTDNNPIYAIIEASGVNHNGKRNGQINSNGDIGQIDLIKSICIKSGIEPQDIGYIEAHGAGSVIGDPLELKTMAALLPDPNLDQAPRYIGSVKTNLGHSHGASAMASIIKVALMLKYQQIVPSLHSRPLLEDFDWQQMPFEINDELKSWPQRERLIALINASGIGGTNAHILMSAPPQPKASQYTGLRLPFVLSAHSPQALAQKRKDLRIYLAQHNLEPYDLAYTLACRRNRFEYKQVFIAGDLTELETKLAANIESQEQASVQPFTIDGRCLPLPCYPFQRQRYWYNRSEL